MEEELYNLHLQAGLIIGQDYTCGKKQQHQTEEHAAKAAARLNQSGKAHHEVEPYPCAFCKKWHWTKNTSSRTERSCQAIVVAK